jgi:outer membrane protein OmpA-like peptidoglycan-associated protein
LKRDRLEQGVRLKSFALAMGLFSLPVLMSVPTVAQTLGYAEAIDQLAKSCRTDIANYCKSEPLGEGRVWQCLSRNRISAGCSSSIGVLAALLKKRAAARAAVPKVCDVDIRRMCAGVQQGDGNLMECFYKARQNVSPACRQAVTDAGYEVALAPAGRAGGPINLSAGQLVNSLQNVESTPATAITAAGLQGLANQALTDPNRASRLNRAPLVGDLDKLAQFTIAVQFDLGSARIRPDSFRAVGLMADALNHPYLQAYRFIVVGHTDATGDRNLNLRLSQQRAEAIRAALINPFGIPPSRVEAVGLGEEQLLNAAKPEAAENRRVQLINIGK